MLLLLVPGVGMGASPSGADVGAIDTLTVSAVYWTATVSAPMMSATVNAPLGSASVSVPYWTTTVEEA